MNVRSLPGPPGMLWVQRSHQAACRTPHTTQHVAVFHGTLVLLPFLPFPLTLPAPGFHLKKKLGALFCLYFRRSPG